MSLCVAEYHALTRLTWAGLKCEPNIHKASFIERRLFYLNRPNVVARALSFFPGTARHIVPMFFRECGCTRSNLQNRGEIAHPHCTEPSAVQVSSERANTLLATTFVLEATLPKTWQGTQ